MTLPTASSADAGVSLSPRIAIPEPATTDPAYSQRSWPVYAKAVERAGGIPIAVPLGESQSTMARLANSCSGILLPGSPADVDPEKYGQQRTRECGPKDGPRESADDLLLQDAFNLHKPILAICYGLQTLNVWRNGTLIQHLPGPPPEHLANVGSWNPADVPVNHGLGGKVKDAHQVVLTRGSKLAAILAGVDDLQEDGPMLRLSVNSSHHQAVLEPGDHLLVTARSPMDGVIEALESPDQFVLGVQWHPERTYESSAASRRLFEAFIDAARVWRPRPITESVQI